MVICKFYANGYCKFGQNCRFEHTDNRNVYSKTYNQSTHSYNQNRNQPQHPQHHNSQNHQHHQSHGGSTFSFSNAAHNQASSTSTFSFNRAADQISAKPQQQNTFSFRDSANQNSFFGNTAGATQAFASSQNNAAKSFSFNTLVQQVNAKPSTFASAPFPAINEATMESETDRLPFTNAPVNPLPSFFASSNVTSTPFGGTSSFSSNANSKSFFQTNIPTNNSSSFFGNNPPTSNNSTFKSFFDKASSRDVQSTSNFATTLPLSNTCSSQSQAYSQLDQLSENDKASYEQREFNVIPLMPPPYEVCF